MITFERVNEKTWRRYGKFRVQDNERTAEWLTTLFAIMQNFVVVRAEYDFAWQGIEYTAISPLFDPVPPGEIPPDYELIVTYLPDNGHTIAVRRRDT